MDTSILFIGLVFVLAGLVKGVTGMGLPTVAVALLTLRMPPLEAAALLIVPSSVTNVWQLAAGPALYPLWLRFRGLLVGVCVGTAIVGAAAAWMAGGGEGGAALGSAPIAGSAARAAGPASTPGAVGGGAADGMARARGAEEDALAGMAGAVLGLALVAYGLLGLTGWRMRVAARHQRWAGPLAGAATGAMSAVTGVFVMPVAPYLQALDLDKDDLVQALGMTFTVGTLALAVMLACRGQWHASAAGGSFLALLPAACGMLLGQWLRDRMHPALFRRCFFAGLVILGAHQLLRIATG
nr:sulfite exporter TauE/SafE family protein [Duganella aceris]